MSYTEFQHKHNFSVWAAARAAQRGSKGSTVPLLRDAIEQCGVTDFSKNMNSITCADCFDKKHREWCNSICDYLKKNVPNITYGRAAKLIAVYLKSIIVLPNINTPQAGFIHPPIDEILLKNLSKLSNENSKILKNTKWTKLDETNYFNVLKMILNINGSKPNWKIEEFWTITK